MDAPSLLLLASSAWPCPQLSRNLGSTFYLAPVHTDLVVREAGAGLVGGVAVAGRRHHGRDLGGRRSREGRRRRRHVRLLDARAQLLELDPPADGEDKIKYKRGLKGCS